MGRKRFGAWIEVSKKVINLADTAERKLEKVVLPRALTKVVPVVKAAMLGLAEFPDSDKTGSKLKQSKKTAEKPWLRMKKNVGVRSRSYEHFVMKIIGVTSDAKHVNFDHGEKAKKTGRVHKLWWRPGISERFAKVNPRIQRHDIPLLTKARVGNQVNNIIEKEIEQAVKSGELIE